MRNWTIDVANRTATRDGCTVTFARGKDLAPDDWRLWEAYHSTCGAEATVDAENWWNEKLRHGSDALARAGAALLGDNWTIADMADLLKIETSTLRSWLSGKSPFPMDHSRWPSILELLQKRQAALETLISDIQKGDPHG